MKTKTCLLCSGLAIALLCAPVLSKADDALNLAPWLSIVGNFDLGYRKTQFFENNQNDWVAQWDTRLEVHPPSGLYFGPYLRFSGIVAQKSYAWENGYLAVPGLGAQIYPFSGDDSNTSWLNKLFGPVRLFGEYNFQDYWGTVNTWRPNHQIRTGMEYWISINSNHTTEYWWAEIWAGSWWQSANEFDSNYNAWINAQSVRAGLRIPWREKEPLTKYLSCVSVYGLAESSLTNHPDYYWENRLDFGGGIRIAPNLDANRTVCKICNHFAIYAEYVHAAAYYHTSAPSSVPDHDLRIGINFSIGDWYGTPNPLVPAPLDSIQAAALNGGK